MYDITPQMDAIKSACVENEVHSLELVGSAARVDFNPSTSDIDFLVTFNGREKLFDRYFQLKSRLESLFRQPIDLIQSSAIRNPIVKQSIERNRVAIYGT